MCIRDRTYVTSQGYLTSSALAGYATQTYVTSQGYITSSALTPYLLSSTAASTYQTQSSMSAYLTKAGNLSGLSDVANARSNLGLGSAATQSSSSFASSSRGLPASGTAGQVVTKVNGSDYNVTWSTIIPGDRYLTTSTTSLTIVNNGTITLTVGTGLSYSTQQDVVVAHDASNHMHGVVTSYNSTNGSMVVAVNQHSGSGTYSSWTVNVGGAVPTTSIAWGSITGTLSSQSDLATALNAKLDSTTAASTYYPISSNPAGYLTSTALSPYLLSSTAASTYYPASNPDGYLTATDAGLTYYPNANPEHYISDAPSDGTIYGRQNGSWVTAGGGGGSFNGGTITNALIVNGVGATSNVTVDTAGLYAYDLGSSGSIGTTLDYAGFNNFSGDDYTNIAPGNVQVRSGGQNIQITSGTITFPDGSYQTKAAPTNNSKISTTVVPAIVDVTLDPAYHRNAVVLCNSGCANVFLTDAGSAWNIGDQVLIVNNTGASITVSGLSSAGYISYQGLHNIGAGGVCAAVYVDTNLWAISGNLTS